MQGLFAALKIFIHPKKKFDYYRLIDILFRTKRKHGFQKQNKLTTKFTQSHIFYQRNFRRILNDFFGNFSGSHFYSARFQYLEKIIKTINRILVIL